MVGAEVSRNCCLSCPWGGRTSIVKILVTTHHVLKGDLNVSKDAAKNSGDSRWSFPERGRSFCEYVVVGTPDCLRKSPPEELYSYAVVIDLCCLRRMVTNP